MVPREPTIRAEDQLAEPDDAIPNATPRPWGNTLRDLGAAMSSITLSKPFLIAIAAYGMYLLTGDRLLEFFRIAKKAFWAFIIYLLGKVSNHVAGIASRIFSRGFSFLARGGVRRVSGIARALSRTCTGHSQRMRAMIIIRSLSRQSRYIFL